MLKPAGKSAAAAVVAAALTGSVAAAIPARAAAPAPERRPEATISWKACAKKAGGRLHGLECGSLRVPLDYGRPDGEKITLALSRAKHTSSAAKYQGAVLLNRGGPGADGLDMPSMFSRGLPASVASTYDWIGFDPRGVGASRPALVCDKSYQDPGGPKPDTIPASEAEEDAWKRKARAYADDCQKRYGKMLPHMGTADWARDMDAIRAALGERKLNFFGYSYGTYLGAVYATMYPLRVRRMALDSVARPSGVWYENNLDQNVAFEKRIGQYFTWIARYNKTYRLGSTRAAVAASYAKARAQLKAKPAKGRVGAYELDDIFLADGYGDYTWPAHARALSTYLVKKNPDLLARHWSPPSWLDQNNYAVYNAVQCRDAEWPRRWGRWHRDNWRLYRQGYRFETWSNAWYNAPCAYWGVRGGPAPAVYGSLGLTRPLLIQASEDAATPYGGAVEMHNRFPGSRLVVQVGGGNHGVALSGDKCVDKAVAAYFADGALPDDSPGPDLRCKAAPPIDPERRQAARRALPEPLAGR
ncbi:alpha/beta hydrolase [Spirillospora sp. CA-294931]|uniref:alpha/beta hydrolase n=1 Tax=Spirillospora sp. CA-294931 TaxID=3240042 RepID=UPI003D921D97